MCKTPPPLKKHRPPPVIATKRPVERPRIHFRIIYRPGPLFLGRPEIEDTKYPLAQTSVQAGAVLLPLAMFLLSLKSIRVLY